MAQRLHERMMSMSAFEKLRRSFEKRRNLAYAKKAVLLDPHPLSYYVGLLASDKPFSFVRYGDGEWSAILGRSGANCDGHEYFPKLGRRLCAALADQYPYFYALQYYGLKLDGRAIADYIRQGRISVAFHNADIFAFANVLGRLNPFIEALRNRPVAIVGPAHLKNLSHVFPVAQFFEVPSRNCFLAADDITNSIREWGMRRDGVVYSFSASMAANVMIHDLYPSLGQMNWLLDLGSLWDIYAGVKSRGWFQSLDLRPAMRRNLGDTSVRSMVRRLRDGIILLVNRLQVKT
jgi:hypothetical protein